jgi:glycosyltransferase involved in cell wall biosynthesis
MTDVTVLVPVHNGERYLRQAIDSVLAQSYPHFECLVVDDGSTDGSAAIYSGYTDARIRHVRVASNQGLSNALNIGLAAARTELIARLDADDVAEPQRLARQREVMLATPSLALLGSQAMAITPDGHERGTVRRPLDSASILWASLFDNPFIHPTVMFRASVVRDELGGFRTEYDPFSQDYDLWCRVMARHAVANLPDRLIRHRVHQSSIMGRLAKAEAPQPYDRRFEGIARDLIVRQARLLFEPDVLPDADAQLLPGLILGLHPEQVDRFLTVFERLLADFRRRVAGTDTADFALTLARQFDALALHVTPPSRRAAARIYAAAMRRHREVREFLPWKRMLALLLFGRSGRERVAGAVRRHWHGAVD